LGHAAVDHGYKVRYFTAAELVETLYLGYADDSVGILIEQLLRADLVSIDEVGFAPLDHTGAQLFFGLVAVAKNGVLSASHHTGHSRSGAASSLSTRPPSACLAASSVTPASSRPRASRTA
jgi:hypothetical protein